MDVNAGTVTVALIAASAGVISALVGWRRFKKNPLENGTDWMVAKFAELASIAEGKADAAEAGMEEMKRRMDELERSLDRAILKIAVMNAELVRLASKIRSLGGDPDEGRPDYGITFESDVDGG